MADMKGRHVLGLDKFFKPESVAVIGASNNPLKGGYMVIRNLLKFDYKGKIYPVNPREREILGLKSYPSVKSIPESVDLAFVIVPREIVPGVIQECADKGIKCIIVSSAGFKESGEEGSQLENKIVEIAKKENIRVIGPNTIGLINSSNNLILSFAPFEFIRKGPVAIIAQSGVFCGAALHWLLSSKIIGISKSVGLGNKCDVTEVEMLEYLGDDEETEIIFLHTEGLKDGREFLRIAREVSKKKPLIVMKFGRTSIGAKAIVSHTGTIAGKDTIFATVLKQIGALRVDDLDELRDLVKILLGSRLISGNRVAIITYSGATGAQTSDLCIEAGLLIPELDEATILKIEDKCPPWMKISNPIDIWPAAMQHGADKIYDEVIRAISSDPNVDVIIVLVCVSYADHQKPSPQTLLNAISQIEKPSVVCTIGTSADIEKYQEILEGNRIPVFTSVKSCVEAISRLWQYSKFRLELTS
jgi:acetyltransferase